MLGQVLIRLGMLSEEQLSRVLEAGELSFWDVSWGYIEPEVAKLVPEQLIREYRLFPIGKKGNRLHVAMANPSNVVAIDNLRLITGLDIEPVTVSEKEINALIEKHFGLPEVEKVLRELGGEPEAADAEMVEAIVDEAPIIRLVNSLIMRALDEEASDIHIEPQEKDIRVRYRVDGMLREVIRLPRRMSHGIVSRERTAFRRRLQASPR
ncbi:MAG: ATPase, T2SS/T4P/T4SS family [Bacillota bacterium]|nr:ATPase, T2SS/T4P/T4SS family [Bacillota bacterium]